MAKAKLLAGDCQANRLSFFFFVVVPVLKSRCHDRSAYTSVSFEAYALSVEIIVFLKTYP